MIQKSFAFLSNILINGLSPTHLQKHHQTGQSNVMCFYMLLKHFLTPAYLNLAKRISLKMLFIYQKYPYIWWLIKLTSQFTSQWAMYMGSYASTVNIVSLPVSRAPGFSEPFMSFSQTDLAVLEKAKLVLIFWEANFAAVLLF